MSITDVELITLQGDAILPYLEDLAQLRITVFREYPYLYDGNMDYEKGYLKRFIENKEALMIIAKDKKNHKVVGVSTGAPLISEMAEAKQPFIDHHYSLEEIFYFSESVLLSSYRGQGIGRYFLEERERMARSHPNIKSIAFCAVERAETHPKKPANYRPLDFLWQKIGFKKMPELFTYYTWQEIGENEESKKKMVFWMKDL